MTRVQGRRRPTAGDQLAEGEVLPEALAAALDELFLSGPEEAAIAVALGRLREALSQHGVVYGVLDDSPVGTIYVALRADRLVAVDFGISQATFLKRLSAEHGTDPIRDDERAGEALSQLSEYLHGERKSFELPVDLSRLTEFQQRVLRAAIQVPRGGLSTYGEIAGLIGKPRAARAVGQALARNPVPIVIPCHRVVAADGALTGYSGGRGIATKETLLRLEGALPG